jgi:hypothetical protein
MTKKFGSQIDLTYEISRMWRSKEINWKDSKQM